MGGLCGNEEKRDSKFSKLATPIKTLNAQIEDNYTEYNQSELNVDSLVPMAEEKQVPSLTSRQSPLSSAITPSSSQIHHQP